MTPLTPEGVSFSGHKSLTGKPCPENVAGADHVRVSRVAADYAAEVGLGEAVLPRAVPTARAGTGGVAGINCDYLPAGAFSLTVENSQEHPPTRVEDASVQDVMAAVKDWVES